MSEIFDAHCHIIDPRFALVENQGYRPDWFTVRDYRSATSGLGVTGGAVVAGSFQGTDHSFLTAALRELGQGWVGVAQLPARVSDEYIAELDRHGVRAARYNLRRTDVDLDAMVHQAHQVYDAAGWHAEIHVDAARLPQIAGALAAMPRVSIDHLGLSDDGLFHLLSAVDWGVHVKASGFGRVTVDVVEALRTIHTVNPQALMFGTDLPGTRAPRAFTSRDLDLIRDALGDEVDGVLGDNARRWYRTPAG